MNYFLPFKFRLRIGLGLVALIAATYMASNGPAAGSDATSTNTTAVATEKAVKPIKVKTKLTGAELYQINCNRCHPERYPTEFNSAQWKTLMLHMRVRANIPASQAKAILKYLQEDSGN
jgi:hypothetical protein